MENIAHVIKSASFKLSPNPLAFCKKLLLLLLFIWLIGNLLSSPSLSLSQSVSTSGKSAAEDYMKKGLSAFRKGAFEQAVLDWRETVKLYEKGKKADKQVEALILLAQAYQYVGQYNEALKSLKSALILAEKLKDRALIASVLSSLGNLYITLGPSDRAYQYLNQSLDMAKELKNLVLMATVLNNLGNLFITEKRYAEAISAYMESIALAEKSNHMSLVARTLTNGAVASMQNGQFKDSRSLLDRAFDETRKLDPSHEAAYGLVNIGLAYYHLRSYLPEKNDLLTNSSQAFQEALRIAETIGDLRALSYACGYTGTLLEAQEKYQEAMAFTRRATLVAQQVNAPECLYLWQWQMGRLLKVAGKNEEAISAYRNSIHTLQSIRQEMLTCYGTPQISFRESVEPIYYGFVDLLLQHTGSIQEAQRVERYLTEAREAVEILKVAELRDYFQDECMGAAWLRTTKLDIVSKTAVVIYPLVLSDRTELLVSLPSGLKKFSVKIGAEVLTKEVRKFREKLEKRTTWECLPHAQRLYDWLIRPLEPDLISTATDTLVFVPDGPLRTVPMAALHDGKRFLIEKYAVAITPGLNLTDPHPIKREKVKVLSAGLTDSVQGFPALPNVAGELQSIQNLYGGHLMMNQNFLIRNLEKELRNKQLNIIHIASHGHFESDVRKSYLLTFDGKLTMDKLEEYVGLFKFRQDPLELLTLSACETALGDDRAALGLAGIAIKSGARSALATLWQIDDFATSELVAEFYRQLKDPTISRAIALKRAQLKLLNDRSSDHPSYWSPFLLINNWL